MTKQAQLEATDTASATDGTAVSRRESLKTLLGALGMFTAGLASVPLYRYFASPALDAVAGTQQTSVTLPGADALPLGEAMLFALNSAPTLLIHHRDGRWVSFRAVCTHLSCTVRYEGAQDRIVCACHEGVFDARDGTVVEGPPPQGLEQLKVEVRNGEVVVSVS
jgi:Rieske Fe-S protein